MYQTLWDMLSTIVSNSHFGKRPTAREMITFVSHVATQRAIWERFFIQGSYLGYTWGGAGGGRGGVT